jgi:hypothetical protein
MAMAPQIGKTHELLISSSRSRRGSGALAELEEFDAIIGPDPALA